MAAFVPYSGFDMSQIYIRFGDFFAKPFQIREMTWIVIPVILTIVVMELYYASHKNERVGWNTATANSLVLIFVAMDLLRFLSERSAFTLSPNKIGFAATLLVLFVLIEGILLVIVNFKHKLPEFLAFKVSSQLSINLTAYMIIVIVYANLQLTISTVLAMMAFFVLINFLFLLLRTFYPSKN